jgi:hypothetical protein
MNLLHQLHSDRRLNVTELRTAFFLLPTPDSDDGHASESWDRLAELTGATVAEVRRAVLKLERLGYLVTLVPRDVIVDAGARAVH